MLASLRVAQVCLQYSTILNKSNIVERVSRDTKFYNQGLSRRGVLYGEKFFAIETLSEEDAANKAIIAVEEQGYLPDG